MWQGMNGEGSGCGKGLSVEEVGGTRDEERRDSNSCAKAQHQTCLSSLYQRRGTGVR